MSYDVSHLPANIQDTADRLCQYLRKESLHGAIAWTIDSKACFEKHGIVWAADRKHCSLDVFIDERKGKVHQVTIELPDSVSLSNLMGSN